VWVLLLLITIFKLAFVHKIPGLEGKLLMSEKTQIENKFFRNYASLVRIECGKLGTDGKFVSYSIMPLLALDKNWATCVAVGKVPSSV
jgi:hypothetical protein